MLIGIVRHFKVDYKFTNFVNSKQYEKELINYENAPIKPILYHYDNDKWKYCYSSNLQRTISSANYIFKNDIIISDLLNATPRLAVFETRIKLPLKLWHFLGKIAWLLNSSTQPETKKEVSIRAKQFVKEVSNVNGNILIVCHNEYMKYILIPEFFKKGYIKKGHFPFSDNSSIHILIK